MEHAILYNFILMFFLSCSYFLHAIWRAPICKPSYEKGELHVDCSNKRLDVFDIPPLPSNTFSLNLQHNGIISIKNNQLKNMRNLTVLDLSFNKLSYMYKGVFSGLKKLQQLRLNNNNLSFNTIAFRSFKPLKSLKLLSIESNKATSYFPAKTIAHLTKLEIFKMDVHESEKNTNFFGKEYCKLPHLHSLHLNIKSTISGIIQLNNTFFQYTPNLTQLHILLFELTFFDTFTLSTLNKLKLLQIDYGNVRIHKTICPFIPGYHGYGEEMHLHWLYISILNLISKVSNSSTENLIIQNLLYHYPEPEKYDFSFCVQNFLDKCLNTSIRQLHVTNIFGLNKMCIPTRSVINTPLSLLLLNLTRNNLTWISLNLPSVVTPDLKHNRLGNYLVNNSYLITQSSKLENISLSHNQIYKLNTEIFKGQPYLKHIDLSFNNISNISFDLSHLEKLQVLNLANNEIKILTKKSMIEIDRLLQKNNDTKIDLRNNPFQCTCNTFSFLQWMRQIRHHFIQFSKYQCISGNVPISKANFFDKAILYLEQDCLKLKLKTKSSTTVTLVVSWIFFGVIAVMVLFSTVIIYKKQWKLRYMYYTARMKYISKEYEDEDSSEHNYDAFISYSDEDRIFVIDHCIKNLEQDRNLKLCIHERDFIPGHDINNNMVTAIQTSRKTICIITRSFLESDFCMFELNMARMESTHSRNGKNILFLVFYEKLSSKDLPLVLCEHIQKQSYIQYPSNEIGIAIFWDKISDAINA